MKIGIYRACGIGDVAQLTPLFQQIRADFPRAHLTFFTSTNVAGIVPACPWLDAVTYFASELISSAFGQWGGLPVWRTISRVGSWDIFLNLDPQWRHSAAFPLVRAARKGGMQTLGWKPYRLFDEFLPLHPVGLDHGHTAWRYLDLWEKLTGQPDRGFGYSLQYPATGRPAIDLPDRTVCLVPGAGNAITPGDAKRWPLEHWLALAEVLAEQGYNPLWLGSAEDAHRFSIPPTKLNLMGKLDLRGSWDVIDHSFALVGNDSGLFHMALASRARAIALFGPTNPLRTGPFRRPDSLVIKAGLGVVDEYSLRNGGDGALRESLDRNVPMSLLQSQAVATEVVTFLNRPPKA